MATSIMSISMPEPLRLWVEDKAFRANYGSVSEYIRELVRNDQRKEIELIDRHESRKMRDVVNDDELFQMLGLDE